MKISIITTSFQSVKSVKQCLRSVFEQTYLDREHICIDGASEDGTLEILQNSPMKPDYLESRPDDGLYYGLNRGISLASGDIIGVLHSDDIFAGNHVLSSIASIFSDASVELVYGDLHYVTCNPDNSGYVVVRNWKAGEFRQSGLNWGWMPPHPTVFLRRSVYERFGLFDLDYKISADYEFILRVLKHLSPRQVVYLPQVITLMKIGGISNRSLKNIARKSWEDYRAVRYHQLGGFRTVVAKNLRKASQLL